MNEKPHVQVARFIADAIQSRAIQNFGQAGVSLRVGGVVMLDPSMTWPDISSPTYLRYLGFPIHGDGRIGENDVELWDEDQMLARMTLKGD